MNLSAYRRALDVISQRLLRTVLAVVAQVLSGSADEAEARRVLVPVLSSEVRGSRREAYDVAVEFLRSQAASQGVRDPYVPVADGYPDVAVDTVLREYMKGTPQEAAAAVAAPLVRHVEDAARRTVVRAVEDEPVDDVQADPYDREVLRGLIPSPRDETRAVGWARVLTGADNCEFCVMLASRGAVYADAEEAGRISASLKWADAKGYVNRYHDNCDCLVVPVYDRAADWPGKEQAAELYKLWEKATKGHSGQGALNALARELSRMEREGEQLPVEQLRAA